MQENELKFATSYNNQLKYSDTASWERSIGKIKKLLGILRIEIEPECRLRNDDTYYDTSTHELAERGMSLRHRRVDNDKDYVTWKLPRAQAGTFGLSRDEFEEEVERDQLVQKLQTCFKKALPETQNTMRPIFTIHNRRTVIPIKTDGGSYELCFDKYYYSTERQRCSDDFYEIEIEAKTVLVERDEQIKQLADIFDKVLGYQSETVSKYKRGLRWLCADTDFQYKSFILFDIVGYSLRPAAEQKRLVTRLNFIIKNAVKDIQLLPPLFIPIGDGVIICTEQGDSVIRLIGTIVGNIRRENNDYGEDEKLCVRCSVHYGQVYAYQDINDGVNYAGGGINLVSRISSVTDPGQILVSEAFFEQAQQQNWGVANFGQKQTKVVKHGVEIDVRNYFRRSDGLGIDL